MILYFFMYNISKTDKKTNQTNNQSSSFLKHRMQQALNLDNIHARHGVKSHNEVVQKDKDFLLHVL